jgi:hypothetical protein
VPARPFSQKMQRSSRPSAQLYISWRRSARVSGRHVWSYCRWYALNGASAAVGRELSTSFKSELPVSFLLLRGHSQLSTLTFAAPEVNWSVENAHRGLRMVVGGHVTDVLSVGCHGLRSCDNKHRALLVGSALVSRHVAMRQKSLWCSVRNYHSHTGSSLYNRLCNVSTTKVALLYLQRRATHDDLVLARCDLEE